MFLKKIIPLMATVVFTTFAASTVAQAAVANFETLSGAQAEGFSDPSAPGLSFFSALGSGLQVSNFGVQGSGTGSLGIFDDTNGNYLKGVFSGATNSLSLDFGNDDPGFSNPGDLAVLKVYLGLSLISEVDVVLNRDDIMNQTISYSGLNFDNFTFAYTNAAGAPNTGGGNANPGLTEIVDNITFGQVTDVPEPITLSLFGVGFAGAVAMRRRRQKS